MDKNSLMLAAAGAGLLVLLVVLFGADTVSGWVEWAGQKAVEGAE